MATSYPQYQHEYNSAEYNIEQLEALPPVVQTEPADNSSSPYSTHSSSYDASQMSSYPRVDSSYPTLGASNLVHDKMNSALSNFHSSFAKPQQNQSSHTPDLLGDTHDTNNDSSFSSSSTSSTNVLSPPLSGSQSQTNHQPNQAWNKGQSAPSPSYASQTQAPPVYQAQSSNSQPQSPQPQSNEPHNYQPQQVHTISPRVPRPQTNAQVGGQQPQANVIQRPQSQPQSTPQTPLQQQFQQMQVSPQEQPQAQQGQQNLLVQQYAQQQSQMQQQKTDQQMQQIQHTVNHQTQQAQLLLQQANVVQAYFNRIMQFMESVDRRLSHLEGLTNNVLKTQQDGASIPISSAELDSARKAQEQLEADMEMARRLQADMEREANQASRSSSMSSSMVTSQKTPSSFDQCPICMRSMSLIELQNHIEACLDQESKKDGPKKDLPDKKSLFEKLFGKNQPPTATNAPATTATQKPTTTTKPAEVKPPVNTTQTVPGMYPMMNPYPMMYQPGQPQQPRPATGQQGVQYMMVPNPMGYPYYPQAFPGQK